MPHIQRYIETKIKDSLFKGKTIIIYGARQVGKTTLVHSILKSLDKEGGYFNCDEPDILSSFSNKTSSAIKQFIGNRTLIVLDDAQRLPEAGMILKLLHDTYPDLQVIATGSSSFELASKINEPLTGRKHVFRLSPLSVVELVKAFGKQEVDRILEQRIILGGYPEIVCSGDTDAIRTIREITQSYLFKDILSLDRIRNTEKLEKLALSLALQVGNEVSYNELAGLTGLDKNTVERYIRILEQAFIVFRLNAFSRNVRNELKKNRKIYFWDTGIRNALIRNLNPLDIRTDKGALWENFLIAERQKLLLDNDSLSTGFFWRTVQQQEIDYVEEGNGTMEAFEIKWRQETVHIPKPFAQGYPGVNVSMVNRETFWQFVGC